MALLRQVFGDDTLSFYDEKTGNVVTGKANKYPNVSDYPEHAGDDLSNESSYIYGLLQDLISMSNQQSEAQNKLQLQMMREANGITVAEGRRQREFNAAEALKAFQRSEQSRLASEAYNTSERIAAQEYATGERLSAQDYNTLERIAAQEYATGERLSAQDYTTRERIAAQEWQEHMSNTQYQRAVKDLYAAGLNPLLAVGAQASYGSVSPGRSSGQSVSPGRSSGQSVSPGRSSASQGYAASSSAGHGNSASAYRSNVESLINGVLSYMSAQEQHEVQRDSSVLGFLGKIFSSLISDFNYTKGSYKSTRR